MKLIVNGKPHEMQAGATLASLIGELGLDRAICAAEVNKQVVRRDDRDGHQLQDGDTVEIVTLVGGG